MWRTYSNTLTLVFRVRDSVADSRTATKDVILSHLCHAEDVCVVEDARIPSYTAFSG